MQLQHKQMYLMHIVYHSPLISLGCAIYSLSNSV